jgi:hypothetical protein
MRPAERERFSALSIVEMDIKAPGDRYDELLELTVRMSCTLGTPWNIVQVVDTLYIERYVAFAFDKR